MRGSLESVAMIVWAFMQPTPLGYKKWVRSRSIGFSTLSEPGHPLESLVRETTWTAWWRMQSCVAKRRYPPFTIECGIPPLLCTSQALFEDQEESLCHRYPDASRHTASRPRVRRVMWN